jgi:hypothetical protein
MRASLIIVLSLLAGCGVEAQYPNGPLTRAQTIAAIKQCTDAGLHATEIVNISGNVLDVVCDQEKEK